MRSQRTLISVVVAFCLAVLPVGVWGYGGTGTAEDPYLIYTAEEMNAIGLNPQDWDKHFRLMEDIDLAAYAGNQFNLIGLQRTAQDPNEILEVPFSGVFDGQGHTIAHFTYEVSGAEAPAEGWVEVFGLFRRVDGLNAEIREVTLLDPNVCPAPNCTQRVGRVGALAGVLESGVISRCHVKGGNVRGDALTGGLVGVVSRRASGDPPELSPTIVSCSTNCQVGRAPQRSFVEVEGADRVLHRYYGGVAGLNRGIISDCNATGPVSGGRYAGGLVGGNGADIVDCQAAGAVSGESALGGLAGEVSYGTIAFSWAGGDVSAPNDVSEDAPSEATRLGGLVGSCLNSTVADCYAVGHLTGHNHIGGLAGIAYDSTIERCYATGMVMADDRRAGGLVGGAESGTVISECHAVASVAVPSFGGGLVGFNGGTIRASWAGGSVSGDSSIGGLVGEQWKWIGSFGEYTIEYGGTAVDCYALTRVICETAQGGGLVGANRGGTVLRCFAAGEVLGFEEIGGLIGAEYEGYPSQVDQSFWDCEATGLNASARGSGLSTAEMQNRATYVEAGWDFTEETANGTEDIWWILEGQDYPRLWWEHVAEE